jgi:hypothetical protein
MNKKAYISTVSNVRYIVMSNIWKHIDSLIIDARVARIWQDSNSGYLDAPIKIESVMNGH